MKAWRLLLTIFSLLTATATYAQKVALPHGMVFGSKADTANGIDANRLRQYMGEKKRITTTIKGVVERVTEEKGGWFVISTKQGPPIYAHFKDYNVTLPSQIKGRTVIVSAVAKREFTADDHQHFAGDTVTYSTTSKMSKAITLEVSGLMIYK